MGAEWQENHRSHILRQKEEGKWVQFSKTFLKLKFFAELSPCIS